MRAISRIAIAASATKRTRSDAIMTRFRGIRSAITPAISRKITSETDRLASTNPRPVGDRSTESTAKGKATGSRPSPNSEKARAM